jgi:hypothetical protein
MIDFPASPTTNQTFYAATNGITYMWTGTIWVATGAGTSPGGDFCAVNPATGIAIGAATYTKLSPSSILSGNSGGWYSTGTGRYTPPAGRYNITAGITGSGTAGLSVLYAYLYKNGASMGTTIYGANTNPSAGTPAQGTFNFVLDANGTDYFELYVWCNIASTVAAISFSAFPISGIKGPPGDLPSGVKLYSEHVVTTPVGILDVTFPSNAKSIELLWHTDNTGGTAGSLNLLVNQSGVPNVSAMYNLYGLYFVGTAPTGAYGFQSQNANSISLATTGIRTFGSIKFSYLGGTLYGVCNYYAFTTGAHVYQSFGTIFSAAGITGFRLLNSAGSPTFLAGSYLRCFVTV